MNFAEQYGTFKYMYWNFAQTPDTHFESVIGEHPDH